MTTPSPATMCSVTHYYGPLKALVNPEAGEITLERMDLRGKVMDGALTRLLRWAMADLEEKYPELEIVLNGLGSVGE